MPEEKVKSSEKPVDVDTSGPEVDVTVEEPKEEAVVQTKEEESTITEVKKDETAREIKKEQKEDDTKLEDYSKGVQSRIAKLTRKMREAERREAAATEYASALEAKRRVDQERFQKVDSDFTKKFEDNIKTGMESAQNELARAIEAGDAQAQVQANKRIATLAFDNAKLEQRKEIAAQEKPVQLSDGGQLPRETPRQMPQADPMAEDWASKNTWFGRDRPMTFTAFEIHKDLVEKEGFDPKSDEYYEEIDKRIKVDFPHKFGNSETTTPRPVQSVASANRSVKQGRKTVRLTSSQVHIAKKLGVPLEEYAKQLKLTEGA
jgi:hypothetical protein